MRRNPEKKHSEYIASILRKHKRFHWVKDYIVSCYNDGTAFEDPKGFRKDIEQFLEPVIAEQIDAIHQMAEMEREILRRDARILILETQMAFDASLKEIFNRMSERMEHHRHNPEEAALIREIEALCSMEITEENAAEHNRRMREALLRTKDIMNPEERKQRLKKSLSEAEFGLKGTFNDEMIIPLRRYGMSREQREAKFQSWLSRHYEP